MTNIRLRIQKLGLSVSLFVWLIISFISASAAVVCVDYAKQKELFDFQAPDFISLVQKASFVLNIPPLLAVWKKYNVPPKWPTRFEWCIYLPIGIVGAVETYLKSLALTLLPGSTYTILFESDLIWNVLLSVTFLRRCYHPLQFLSPCFIAGSVIIVAFSKENNKTHHFTSVGKFGGVFLALGSTFLTASIAIVSDWLLKKMMTNELTRRTEQENLVSVQSETDAEKQEQLLERNKSKIWYQNMEQVRNLEFTFWSSLMAFLFLIIWVFVDPAKEYKKWPSKFQRVRDCEKYSSVTNEAIFIILMFSLSLSRLFVRLSMNHILMVLSAFFFAVWKPFRRIGTEFTSIALFGDVLDLYKGLAIVFDCMALLLFVLGGYYYKIQKKKERQKNIDLE